MNGFFLEFILIYNFIPFCYLLLLCIIHRTILHIWISLYRNLISIVFLYSIKPSDCLMVNVCFKKYQVWVYLWPNVWFCQLNDLPLRRVGFRAFAILEWWRSFQALQNSKDKTTTSLVAFSPWKSKSLCINRLLKRLYENS